MHIRKFLAESLMVVGLIISALLAAAPVCANAHTQCAPYAREVSGIDLHGAAGGWWSEADGIYKRGQSPRIGSVLAFRATHTMPSGHVAVVRSVIDSRHILLNHANWSRPGMIERAALAEDVSPEGDWSQVRVWYAPIGALGLRAVPAYGFIYPRGAHAEPSNSVADAGTDSATIGG